MEIRQDGSDSAETTIIIKKQVPENYSNLELAEKT